jgi:glycosyltransferase involved in cell wall biosynthesis
MRTLDPHTGGPGLAIRKIVAGQVARGHRVSLLATTVQAKTPWAPRDEYVKQMQSDRAFDGAEVHQGTAFGRGRLWMNYAFSPECRRWLRRRLADRQSAPDVVHIHEAFNHITCITAATARRNSVPYIVRPAGSLDDMCVAMGHHRLKQAFLWLSLGKAMRHAARVQATGLPEAEQLRRWVPSERIRVVPHGVDVPHDDPARLRPLLLAEFPQLRGKRVLLFMSRIHPIKRLGLLLEGFGRVHHDCPDLALLVAGQDRGDLAAARAAVQRLRLENAVVFAGFLQGELKQGAFAVADLFVLTSLHENFGMAAVEAMASGLPVLVTPGVASHVYVDQSRGGMTVEENAEAVAAGIREILAGDPAGMGRRGRDYVEEHLSWPAVLDQLDRLYRECLR